LEDNGTGSPSKRFGDCADALLIPVIADDKERVNHTRQPAAKCENEADKKAPHSPSQKYGERRKDKAKKEVHDE
jgi:hypothetical protein